MADPTSAPELRDGRTPRPLTCVSLAKPCARLDCYSVANELNKPLHVHLGLDGQDRHLQVLERPLKPNAAQARHRFAVEWEVDA